MCRRGRFAPRGAAAEPVGTSVATNSVFMTMDRSRPIYTTGSYDYLRSRVRVGHGLDSEIGRDRSIRFFLCDCIRRKRTFGGLKAYLRATNHTCSNIISRDIQERILQSKFHNKDIIISKTATVRGLEQRT
jgi:hypothetical protein